MKLNNPGGGTSVDLANPGPIGGTTAAAGTFTALAAASAVLGTNVTLTGPAAATLQLGADHATVGTAQRIRAHGVTTGTGADLELFGGSGSVASGNVKLGANVTVSPAGRVTCQDIVVNAGGSWTGAGAGISAAFLYAGTGLAAGRVAGLLMASGSKLQFSSGSYLSGTMDTVLERLSAGALGVTDGAGGWASLRLGTTSDALHVGTHSAIGGETVTGYITIKDSGGTDRKIAVVS